MTTRLTSSLGIVLVAAAWMAEKLREAGVPDVHVQELDLPPQRRPVSWEVTASLGSETVTLESAMPFTRTAATPADGLENTTRSYAKIIAESNRFDRSQLQSPEQAEGL